ncbi:unnamed protein product [Lactuca virosa]|uniref:DRBM domain-containing protein n=1 Tax=Lactuca virosa TaxID=75947 RepID=A0AAU9NMZ7_9ASTR|nr:unnamed protein product [Lactuca virosa]
MYSSLSVQSRVIKGSMDIDLSMEVGPTEETVEALMEYLVGPLLPLKHSDTAKDTPSQSQQKSVAKQVHAAAVLYNYYHLNQHQEKEFLKFDQFCNLAIMFKPSILQHMKYMTQSNRPTINEPENQLSLTEKAIMDACTISETLLHASSNISNMIKEWPVTKVAIFLIDSKKENCFLQFDNGVWSVIEKDLYCEESGIENEGKKGKKRKLSLMRKYDEEGEDELQKVAFSAVKEIAGINSELKVLEDHVVYSLSQAKTATHFYILQSTQSISEDKLVPIQDAISSLHGPVVKKISGSWVITPVVEYYYLLPYAEIISKWFKRSNGLTDQMEEGTADSKKFQGSQKSTEKQGGQSNRQIKSKMESKSIHISNSNKKDEDTVTKTRNISNKDMKTPTFEPINEAMKTENSNGKKTMSVESDCSKQKEEVNGSCGVKSNDSSTESYNNNNNNITKPIVCLQKEIQNAKMHSTTPTPLKVYHHEKRTTPTNAISIKDNVKNLKNMSIINECKDKRVDGEKKSGIVSVCEDKSRMLKVDADVAKTEPLGNFQFIVDAKRSELSEAALRALFNKRQKLSNQQRNIEDELSLCEKKIQAIMEGGIGDCLGLKLEAVIDCCNEICQQGNMQIQDMKVGRSLPLSEAQLTLRKACEELDDICLSNSWMLPTYHMSRSDGGFVANVSVKGSDFECSGVSGMQQSIREARNSAATHVITKLQQMALNHTTAIL